MHNVLVLLPPFAPFGGIALSLLLARRRRLRRAVAMAAGVVALLASIAVLYQNWVTGTPQTYQLGGWQPPFGIVLVADMFSGLFGVMSALVMTAGLLYTLGCKDRSVSAPAFMPLFLGVYAGLLGSMYSGDFFTVFVFLELMVISSIALVGISDHRLGIEAAIKYLFISSIGTLLLLLGVAALYASFGTLNMADIARLLDAEGRPLLAPQAAIMLMAAFMLKSAIFPFHFWQPDFHTTAPTPVHAVLSSVVVKIGVYGIIRMITLLFTEEAALIQTALIVLGIIGIFFGGLSALRTYDGKRMLAYSTFGQIGFILVGIGWGTPLALVAALVYAVNHSLIKSALLMLMGAIASNHAQKTAELSKMVGLGKQMHFANVLYVLGGMALAGVPPLNGFISKLVLVQAGIGAQGWLALGLVVAAGLLTLLYMIGTWQTIFQKTPSEPPETKKGDSLAAPAILIGMCVLLGLYAAPLIDLATLTVTQIGDPQIYIAAVLGG